MDGRLLLPIRLRFGAASCRGLSELSPSARSTSSFRRIVSKRCNSYAESALAIGRRDRYARPSDSHDRRAPTPSPPHRRVQPSPQPGRLLVACGSIANRPPISPCEMRA